MPRTKKPDSEKLVPRQIKFRPAQWAELQARVPSGEVSRLVREAVDRALREFPTTLAEPGRPAYKVILDIFSDLPEEEKARMPADLSVNLDHYVYGTPRKPE